MEVPLISNQHELKEFIVKYDKLRDFVEEHLDATIKKEFPQELYAPMKYALSSGGKRLRPVIVLLSCNSVGGDYRAAVKGALAVEIMHNFTLVHDDIMDNDFLRRGKPTVFRKWDINTAILAGDGLMSLAFKILAETSHTKLPEIFHIFSGSILTICEGQALDKEFESMENVSVEEYMDMISRKTAVLFSTCCRIGGIIGNAEKVCFDALKNFGLELGIAFQIQDDLMDIVSEEKDLGKDIGSDIAQGKKSYPFVLLEKELDSEEMSFYVSLRRRERIDENEMERIKDILNKYDIIQKTNDEIVKRITTAQKILLDADLPFSDDLIKISQLIHHRES